MIDFCITNSHEEFPLLVSIRKAWMVCADTSYDVCANYETDVDFRIIRTHRGSGHVQLKNGSVLDLEEDSLLITRHSKIDRYWSTCDEWSFFWFECDLSGENQLPQDRVFTVKPVKGEDAQLEEIYEQLSNPDKRFSGYASSLLNVLLRRWMIELPVVRKIHPHQDKIARVIQSMHQRIWTPWRVSDMSKFSALNERSFRKSFREITGESPKRYFENLRIEFAEQLMCARSYSIDQMSERMGYSSPFHFSKSFRQHRGYPPSRVRNGKQQ